MGPEVNGWIVVVNASVKRKLSLKAKVSIYQLTYTMFHVYVYVTA